MKNKKIANNEQRIVDPSIALEVAHAQKSARDMALYTKQQALGQTGLKKVTEGLKLRREEKYWSGIADRQAAKAEEILSIDIPSANKALVRLFQEKIPNFDEAEGFWGHSMDSISWRTDPATQKKVLELRTEERLETGMHYNWLLVLSDEDKEPELYSSFSSYNYDTQKHNTGEQRKMNPQDQLKLKTEINRIYGVLEGYLEDGGWAERSFSSDAPAAK